MMFDRFRHVPAAFLLALLVPWFAVGCSMSLELDEEGQSPTEQAREHLSNHEVDAAQSLYADALTVDPTHGEAAAGKAITDLLVLAEAPALEPLWSDFLGASATFDASEILYANGGMFYWASRGVPWEDNGDYAGIRSLISDRLPWPDARLGSLYDFTRGLDRPADDALASTVALADALAQVERELQIAIDDPDFEVYVLPGEVFHAADADVVLGRAELSVLEAGISFVRGVIYTNAAYAHEWTPQDAVVSIDGERQEQVDHAVGYLDTRLFRSIDAPDRLADGREAFANAFTALRASIWEGQNDTRKTAIDWQNLTSAERQQLLSLLTSLQESLYGRTPIPYTEPSTTMDLSAFFEGGRVLPASDDANEPLYWLTPMAPEDGPSEAVVPGWRFNDAALQGVFVDGVFEPTFRVGGSNAPQLQISGNVKHELVPTVAADLNEDVQKTY